MMLQLVLVHDVACPAPLFCLCENLFISVYVLHQLVNDNLTSSRILPSTSQTVLPGYPRQRPRSAGVAATALSDSAAAVPPAPSFGSTNIYILIMYLSLFMYLSQNMITPALPTLM